MSGCASARRALKGYKVLDDALEGKEWLVNNTFSAADIAVRAMQVDCMNVNAAGVLQGPHSTRGFGESIIGSLLSFNEFWDLLDFLKCSKRSPTCSCTSVAVTSVAAASHVDLHDAGGLQCRLLGCNEPPCRHVCQRHVSIAAAVRLLPILSSVSSQLLVSWSDSL